MSSHQAFTPRTALLLAGLAVISAGCGRAHSHAADASRVVIGFTASQTGTLNIESARQVNGLTLWIEEVNRSGGVTLADGTAVTFAARYYDDESNKDRVQELYTRLVGDDGARILISPYSSGLADAAAVIAEQYDRIMITAGAASDSTHRKGCSLVYQVYTPASRYLTGAFNLLRALDPKASRVAIVHEKDKFSTDVCDAAKSYGEKHGFRIAAFEGYYSGTTDFAPFIGKIPRGADAVMGGGHFADGCSFARQLFEKGAGGKFTALLVAAAEPKFAALGEAAFGVIGPSQWEPLCAYSPESARLAGVDWYGPPAAEFIEAYRKRFGEEPSYHSAGGYAAGLLIQRGIEKAGRVETAALKSALDGIDMLTFFGRTKFDVRPDSHGIQIGHEMVYIQWQRNAAGALVRQVVWPEEGRSAPALYPAR